MNRQNSRIWFLLRLSQPLSLLAGICTYFLGGLILRFIGNPIRFSTYFIGLGCVTMLQLSSSFLKAYYDRLSLDDPTAIRRATEDPDGKILAGLPKTMFLQVSFLTLTVGAVLTVLLFAERALKISGLVVLGVAFLLSFFYAVPPVRLEKRGYGELISTFVIAILTPAMAFSFQTGETHRLLAMITFPVSALYLAASIAFILPKYASDLKYDRSTLITRLGWKNASNLHNLLILVAYLMFGAASILGLPWGVTWPALLTLPVGIFQIFQMNQIGAGAKPRWTLLKVTAASSVGVTIYLLCFALLTG